MTNQMQAILIAKDTSYINIVCILGCINNITFNGMSGQECYERISNLHSNLRENGFKAIAISLTSRRQLSYFPEEKSQELWKQITIANCLFKSNAPSFCDYYLDLQKRHLKCRHSKWIGFAGYEAATRSAYFLDGCHFSNEGKQRIARLLKSAIKKLR